MDLEDSQGLPQRGAANSVIGQHLGLGGQLHAGLQLLVPDPAQDVAGDGLHTLAPRRRGRTTGSSLMAIERYRPLSRQDGGRFSRNAAAPSARSSPWKNGTFMNWAASSA